jgi:hypothetical protein
MQVTLIRDSISFEIVMAQSSYIFGASCVAWNTFYDIFSLSLYTMVERALLCRALMFITTGALR